MQAEIISIGTELLLGEIVDTNSVWIAQQLATIGLNLYYTVTVGDNLARITEIMRSCLERSDIVITTGGLGPTVDDLTREAVAAATERELVLDEDLLAEIRCFFAQRNHPMSDNNRKQAYLPSGARAIHNPVGTAPAFAAEHNGHLIISLPGVPHEMRYLMENEVLPYLRQRYDLTGVILSRLLHTCGIGESTVGARIGDLMRLTNPTVGTAAHPGQTDIRIAAKADDAEAARSLIAPVEHELRSRLGEYIYGADEETIFDVIGELLNARRLKLALVETVTVGKVARALNDSRRGAEAFAGSVVAGDLPTLRRALGAPSLGNDGARLGSQETADAAARGVRRLYEADLGLALLGDRAKTDGPPVYLSLATADETVRGTPRSFREGPAGRGWLVHLALDLVRRHLLGLPIR